MLITIDFFYLVWSSLLNLFSLAATNCLPGTSCSELSGPVDTTSTTYVQGFVLQNTKNSDILTHDILPQIEKVKISCPRCRYIFEILKKIPIIKKNNVIGMCDLCCGEKLKESCRSCEIAINKFISSTTEPIYHTQKLIKTWLSKINQMNQPYNITVRPNSGSLANIEELCDKSIKSLSESKIKKMVLLGTYAEDDPSLIKQLQRQLHLEDFVTFTKFDEAMKHYITSSEVTNPFPSIIKTEDTRHYTSAVSLTGLNLPGGHVNIPRTQDRILSEKFRYYFPNKNILPGLSPKPLPNRNLSENFTEKRRPSLAGPDQKCSKQVKKLLKYNREKTKHDKEKVVSKTTKAKIHGENEKTKKLLVKYDLEEKSDEINKLSKTFIKKKSKEAKDESENQRKLHNKVKMSPSQQKNKEELDEFLKLRAQYAKQKDPEKKDGHILNTTGMKVLKYALSDNKFIYKGWTKLPSEKLIRKMDVYRMWPAHPEFDCFNKIKETNPKLYATGEKLAEFDNNGHGRWYYRNGRLALDYYSTADRKAKQRFIIYSTGEPDDHGRNYPVTVLGTFDYLGNGIIFDHTGNMRLVYNQTEGKILDEKIGPLSHWRWHSLNDPPVLDKVFIETHLAPRDPFITKLDKKQSNKNLHPGECDEMLAIEFANRIKEKNKKLMKKYIPFQIKTKAVKINENFALKILDQSRIYLIFREGSTNMRLNVGMVLDPKELIGIDSIELGEVSNGFERLQTGSESLCALQNNLKNARKNEQVRMQRENRLRRPVPEADMDKLLAGTSRPLKLPYVKTILSHSSDTCVCNL